MQDTRAVTGLAKGSERSAAIGWTISSRLKTQLRMPSCGSRESGKGRLGRITVEPLASGTQRIGGTGEFTVTRITTGRVPAGQHKFALVSTSGTGVRVGRNRDRPGGERSRGALPAGPARPGAGRRSLRDRARAASWSTTRGLKGSMEWRGTRGPCRFASSSAKKLDVGFGTGCRTTFRWYLRGPGEGHFTDLFWRPIPIGPQSSRVVYGVVCDGTREEATRALAGFPAEDAPARQFTQ